MESVVIGIVVAIIAFAVWYVVKEKKSVIGKPSQGIKKPDDDGKKHETFEDH